MVACEGKLPLRRRQGQGRDHDDAPSPAGSHSFARYPSGVLCSAAGHLWQRVELSVQLAALVWDCRRRRGRFCRDVSARRGIKCRVGVSKRILLIILFCFHFFDGALQRWSALFLRKWSRRGVGQGEKMWREKPLLRYSFFYLFRFLSLFLFLFVWSRGL